MADNKKSFILYGDIIHTVNKLPDDKAGELFKLILAYVNDDDPSTDDLVLSIAFEPIKQQLKRDLQKYEGIREKRRAAGASGGKKKAANLANATDAKPDLADLPVNDNDNVNDNVNDTDNVNEISLKKKQKFIYRKALLDYGFNKDLVSDYIAVRSKKKAANTETAFNAFIREVENALYKGYLIDEILELCIVKSWQGFKAEWIEDKNDKKIISDDDVQREVRAELKNEGLIN